MEKGNQRQEGLRKRKSRGVKSSKMMLNKGGFLLNGSPLISGIAIKNISYKYFKKPKAIDLFCPGFKYVHS